MIYNRHQWFSSPMLWSFSSCISNLPSLIRSLTVQLFILGIQIDPGQDWRIGDVKGLGVAWLYHHGTNRSNSVVSTASVFFCFFVIYYNSKLDNVLVFHTPITVSFFLFWPIIMAKWIFLIPNLNFCQESLAFENIASPQLDTAHHPHANHLTSWKATVAQVGL